MPVKHDAGHTETGVRGAAWVFQSQKLASFAAQLRTLTWCLFLLRWDYLVCKGEVLGFYSSQLVLLFGHGEYVALFSLHADPVLKQTLSSLIFFSFKTDTLCEDHSYKYAGFVKSLLYTAVPLKPCSHAERMVPAVGSTDRRAAGWW